MAYQRELIQWYNRLVHINARAIGPKRQYSELLLLSLCEYLLVFHASRYLRYIHFTLGTYIMYFDVFLAELSHFTTKSIPRHVY